MTAAREFTINVTINSTRPAASRGSSSAMRAVAWGMSGEGGRFRGGQGQAQLRKSAPFGIVGMWRRLQARAVTVTPRPAGTGTIEALAAAPAEA